MLIESLKNRIQELELEIQELGQIAEHTTQVRCVSESYCYA